MRPFLRDRARAHAAIEWPLVLAGLVSSGLLTERAGAEAPPASTPPSVASASPGAPAPSAEASAPGTSPEQSTASPEQSTASSGESAAVEGATRATSTESRATSTSTESSAEPRRILVDRAVVRFSAPEAGGRTQPHFVFERELAFEARLVALTDPAHPASGEPFRRHHLQAALERHVAETLLASLAMTPEPTAEEFARQQQAARELLVNQVGGELALLEAARAEGVSSLGLRSLLRRRARASLYLDRMVAPMLEPSALELRRVHAETKTPFSEQPFEQARPALERWYVARSLTAALGTYFQNARARLSMVYVGGRAALLSAPDATEPGEADRPARAEARARAPKAPVAAEANDAPPTSAPPSPARPAESELDASKPNPLTSGP